MDWGTSRLFADSGVSVCVFIESTKRWRELYYLVKKVTTGLKGCVDKP